MQNSFCNGFVVHNRSYPKAHKFTYNMSWCLLNTKTIEEQFSKSIFYSLNKFNIISLRQKDYVSDENESIDLKIRSYIETKIDRYFDGEIYLFTHPRFLGFGFNSVNFYFCFKNNTLQYIVSEINNTPWRQKHLYFHNIKDSDQNPDNASFKFDKEFHISPFVDMDIKYTWNFKITDTDFDVSMLLKKKQVTIMNVALKTQLQPMNASNQFKWMITKPFQSLKMFSGIYWQALKIWFKKIPLHSNPDSQQTK